MPANNASLKSDNIKAWGISVGIHVILLLLFLVIKYDLPAFSHQDEDLLEVALGTDEEGWGDTVPEWMEAPAPTNPTQGGQTAYSEDIPIEAEERQVPDAVKVRKNQAVNTPNPNRNVRRDNTPNRQSTSNNNSNQNDNTPPSSESHRGRVFSGSGPGGNDATRDNPGGRGTGEGQQSRGTAGGSPTGTDIRPRSTFKNRKITAYPDPKAKYNQSGKVVIQVWIDRNGNITRHQVKSFKHAGHRDIALQKLKSIKFNKSASAPETETGNIEFDFSVK